MRYTKQQQARYQSRINRQFEREDEIRSNGPARKATAADRERWAMTQRTWQPTTWTDGKAGWTNMLTGVFVTVDPRESDPNAIVMEAK